jgi:prefoldin beta subunit
VGEAIPPALQEEIARIQQIQQTLQAVSLQRQQLELELMGIERAVSELERLTDDAVVYKSVGSILIRSTRQLLLQELKERKELLNTRVATLTRQEERARERLKDSQQRLQEKLKLSNLAP